MRVVIEISAGELIDRITILELKAQRLLEPYRSQSVCELTRIRGVRDQTLQRSKPLKRLTSDLHAVNRELWDTEEELRQLEREHSFGDRFIALARLVYLANDRRAAIKREIDTLCGSRLREIKSYALPQL